MPSKLPRRASARRRGALGKVFALKSEGDWERATRRANGRCVVVLFMAPALASCAKARQVFLQYAGLTQFRNLVFAEVDLEVWDAPYRKLGAATVPTFAAYIDAELQEHFSGGTAESLLEMLRKYAHVQGRGGGAGGLLQLAAVGLVGAALVGAAVFGVRALGKMDRDAAQAWRASLPRRAIETGGGLRVGIRGVEASGASSDEEETELVGGWDNEEEEEEAGAEEDED